MTIEARCPHCGQQYELAEQTAGKAARCRNCNATFQIPALVGAEPTAVEVLDAYASPLPDTQPTGSLSRVYRAAHGLVLALTILLVVHAIFSAVLGLLDLLAVTTDLDTAGAIDLGDGTFLTGFDIVYALGGLGMMFVYLVTAIVFLVWIHRANSNARALGATGMKFSPGWCVGWFFIPIMNLFKPYQAMREIAQASDPQAGPSSWRSSEVPSIIHAWWGLWIISNVLGQIEFRLAMREDAAIVHASAVLGVVTSILGVVLCFAALSVVRTIHSRQQAKAVRALPRQASFA